MKHRVIIAGSRGVTDYSVVKRHLDTRVSPRRKDIEIVSGTAAGADRLGERWARERGYPVKRFPAAWEQYGRRAGFIRNEEMAQYATALVAFWDGASRGTQHMIDLAHRYGLHPIVVIRI